MATLNDGIGFRRELAHCGEPCERERMRQVPANGTRSLSASLSMLDTSMTIFSRRVLFVTPRRRSEIEKNRNGAPFSNHPRCRLFGRVFFSILDRRNAERAVLLL